MGIIFSRLKQTRTQAQAQAQARAQAQVQVVRRLSNAEQQTIRKNINKIRISDRQRSQQRDNQIYMNGLMEQNIRMEIKDLKARIEMLEVQRENCKEHLRRSNLSNYQVISSFCIAIKDAQKQIELLESKLQINDTNERLFDLQDKNKDKGLQCSYQNSSKKIGTCRGMFGAVSENPYVVCPTSEILYKVPPTSIVNFVEYKPRDLDDQDYTLYMYNKEREINDNTTSHVFDDYGIHAIKAPIISVDIKRSGSIDFTTYDNNGNLQEVIHKDQHGDWE